MQPGRLAKITGAACRAGVRPPRRARSDTWHLSAKAAGLLVGYAAISTLSAIPGAHLPPDTPQHRLYFAAETAFEVLLTAGLVAILFRLVRHHLGAPIRQANALLQLLAELTDTREHAVFGHSQRVGAISRALAEALRLKGDAVERIAYAGLLHDIGKIGVPDNILQKPGALDDRERAVMMSHAALGASIVLHAGPLAALAPLIRHHHEWWNGEGYPDRLAGEDLPLGACIIGVADALDTMTSGRPYRPALSPAQALGELERRAGTQFAPHVVAALRTALPELAGVAGSPAPRRDAPATLAEQEAAAPHPGPRRQPTGLGPPAAQHAWTT